MGTQQELLAQLDGPIALQVLGIAIAASSQQLHVGAKGVLIAAMGIAASAACLTVWQGEIYNQIQFRLELRLELYPLLTHHWPRPFSVHAS